MRPQGRDNPSGKVKTESKRTQSGTLSCKSQADHAAFSGLGRFLCVSLSFPFFSAKPECPRGLVAAGMGNWAFLSCALVNRPDGSGWRRSGDGVEETHTVISAFVPEAVRNLL